MTRWGPLVLAAAVLAAATVPLVACGLDFDRYDPLDASPEVSTGDAWSSGGSSQDASSEGVRSDSRSDAAPADTSPERDAGAACIPPASCLQQATLCGSTCGQAYQRCDSGTQNCTNTEQSCLGKCATTCIGCTQDAGCAAPSKCLDAAHP